MLSLSKFCSSKGIKTTLTTNLNKKSNFTFRFHSTLENGVKLYQNNIKELQFQPQEFIDDLSNFITLKNKRVNAVISQRKKDFILKGISKEFPSDTCKNPDSELQYKNKYTSSMTSNENLGTSSQKNINSRNPGLLMFIKDNIATTNEYTTCSSKSLENYLSPYDATVVELLEKSGAVILGKTNMDEFGMGSTSTKSVFGPVKHQMNTSDGKNLLNIISSHSADNLLNPKVISSIENDRHVQDRCAGGSSGGSAVAVASRFCNAALGSDTGGSVRLPAAWTGVVGFKPSYGKCSRHGLIAYANSLDTIGILAESVETAKREYYVTELSESVLNAWKDVADILESMGATVTQASLPNTKYGLSTYYTIISAEASSNMSRYDGIRYGHRSSGVGLDIDGHDAGSKYANTRSEGLGSEVKRRIILGNYVLSLGAYDDYYTQALKMRQLIRRDFNNVFSLANPLDWALEELDSLPDENVLFNDSGVDLILMPTSVSTSPILSDNESNTKDTDSVHEYVNDAMTVPTSLAGVPTICVPVGISAKDGFPIGLQLAGQYGDDELVLEVANLLQKKLFDASKYQGLFGSDNQLSLVPKSLY
ncbi:hypothetical protein BB558_004628 [Smittium angustum]|uniref:Glutamyl-tRNA(Gln) amidotransferase subunit A, mitochondrial n=1 Tax=Smittium angustum TaxID=133377 RepID=A0A2U1J2Q2_SMIAN|nr:hypothetical protein BB558_004628 [Smittium angustum]